VRKMLVVSVFMLATLAWVAAQQSGGVPQTGAQAGSQGQAANVPSITEGCLGGSNPNFTITDEAGKTYKLNLPANADASTLTPHVGESVQVMGDVKDAGTPRAIDVSRIGKGTGTCPSSSPSGAPPPPKP
jgi:uncharacterized protein YdeI (BOF family)